jgi:hypothetical protein
MRRPVDSDSRKRGRVLRPRRGAHGDGASRPHLPAGTGRASVSYRQACLQVGPVHVAASGHSGRGLCLTTLLKVRLEDLHVLADGCSDSFGGGCGQQPRRTLRGDLHDVDHRGATVAVAELVGEMDG